MKRPWRMNYLFLLLLVVMLSACAGSDGADGLPGADGADGTDGADGSDGADGADGANGLDGADGADGADGVDGVNGVDGQDGAAGQDGQDVDPATVEDLQNQIDALSAVEPESCAICHAGAGEKLHQGIYDKYDDASALVLTVTGVTSVADGNGGFNATMNFTITKNGLPYLDVDGLPSLDQKRFYTATYDAATGKFYNSQSFGNILALGNGQYSASANGMSYAPENSDAEAYGYIASGKLDTESGGHVTMYDDVSNAGKKFGALATTPYVSAANVEGCEKCHGAPYMKHGYRGAEATGLDDFAACKTCHYDNRNGGHPDWQVLVNDPARFADLDNNPLTDAEKAQYAYTANIMNDVHMSHGMEFPYPQSMSTCNTCHEGKLDRVLSDDNFALSTCKSCHAMTGSEEYGTADRALETIVPHAINPAAACNSCHNAAGVAPVFSEIHSGYDKMIYTADGTKYSEIFSVSIDDADLDGNMLTISFSAHKTGGGSVALAAADIVPTIMVGLYGYDTKDYIVGPHERDADRNRFLEMAIDGETENPRFTVNAAANGSWTVTADLSLWADLLTSGVVKRAEIAVEPQLVMGEGDDAMTLALNAPSRTFDLVANAFDDGFYPDIVRVEDGCNNCHDALATTFHSGNRGGNIKVCRLCHITKSGGSHLEMQSRSIDSYVHAIHSFQPFDSGDVNFADPVEAARYNLHIEHTYPNFTIKNCESCHNEGMFEAPDQNKSLPGLFSAADAWETADREIGAVPSYVAGPGSRACGSCHRAEMINEDMAGELIAFNQHTKENGYLVENVDGLLEAVIETIMSYFE